MAWIELQRRREPMREAEFVAASGATGARTQRGAPDSKCCVVVLALALVMTTKTIQLRRSLVIRGFQARDQRVSCGTNSTVIAPGFSKQITVGF
jgi:hypothetical protein